MTIKYQVNMEERGREFPHYWEVSVGSCHAATILRADVQNQLRKAKKDIGFQYLRFHGLLDDDMSVVIDGMVPGLTPRQISFFNIDRVFDFLLEIGMKPFVELGFMPEALASGDKTGFHYKNNITPPAKYEEWESLITQLAEHLEARYGVREVRTWFFEVWNEPNLSFFWHGTRNEYFQLYKVTAKALKRVDSQIKVGGPATSNNMWIPEFRKFCEKNQVPYDFITTHHYPSDDPLSQAGMNEEDKIGQPMDPELLKMLTPEKMQEVLAQFTNRENKNPRDILYRLAKKVKEEAGDVPVYYTEWNVGHYDTSYAAAGVLATLAYNENLVEGYSYWCISDIFEEMGLHGLPFNDEFGLVNVYGTPKPVYRLFQALHMAGGRRLDVAGDTHRTAEVLVLSDDDEVMIFAYNHDIEKRDIKTEEMEITVHGSAKRIRRAVIDSEHTNPLSVWEAQGKPAYPTGTQLLEMRNASRLVWEEVEPTDERQVFQVTATPESVTIFRIEK